MESTGILETKVSEEMIAECALLVCQVSRVNMESPEVEVTQEFKETVDCQDQEATREAEDMMELSGVKDQQVCFSLF